MSVPDSELEEPIGEPEHLADSDACRCADCTANRMDDVADMEASECVVPLSTKEPV